MLHKVDFQNSIGLWLLLFFGLGLGTVIAQEKLSFQVVDQNRQPLSAHVYGFSDQKDPLWVLVADREGQVSIPLKSPLEKIEISHVGFEKRTVHFPQLKNLKGEILLISSSQDLEEVSVLGRKEALGTLSSSLSTLQVSKEQMLNQQSITFAGALENLPGVQAMNVGVGISKPMIRGLSFNRILIEDSGIKQEGQQWGADHGLEIDPHTSGDVEIFKGPVSLIFGPDALGGVVKIHPTPAPETDGITGAITLDAQSNSRLIGSSINLLARKGQYFGLGTLSVLGHGDYEVPADRYTYAGYLLPIADQRLKNTAGRQLNFSLGGGKVFSNGETRLTLSRFGQEAGIFTGAVGIPTAYSLEDDGDSRDIQFPRQINTHWKLISNTHWTIAKKEYHVNLGYQANRRQEESLPHVHGVGPTPSGNLALGLSLDTYTANFSMKTPISVGSLQVGWMNQFMNNTYDGFEFLLPAYRSLQSGIYGVLEWPISEEISWNLGARVDAQRLRIDEHLQPIYERLQPTGEYDQRNPDISRNPVAPSISTGWVWQVDDQKLIKFNLGSGIRFPTPIELASNGIHHGNFRHEKGNSTLATERSWQADLGFSQEWKTISFAISPFVSIYQDFIYLAPSGRFSPLPGSSMLWEYRQDNALFAGGEIQLSYYSPWKLKTTIIGEYVWNQNLETLLPLPLTPPASILASLDYPFPKFSSVFEGLNIGMDFRNTFDQNRVARNEQPTPGYFLIDWRMSGRINISQKPLELNLSIRNLGNVRYMNHLSRYRLINIPEPGRNISLSLTFPLN
ncbi:TonB-dependent receptor [Algoriphagus taiwanensis]|uniref:TonB-dependent receptor n=1 Tax=Algoriphagus taiwanensis TaxID=1445656 RepID=A0ABQ6PWD4_9BACT|nr:TonB-dependent receptor [Algoriphagus taiwanensis]